MTCWRAGWRGAKVLHNLAAVGGNSADVDARGVACFELSGIAESKERGGDGEKSVERHLGGLIRVWMFH